MIDAEQDGFHFEIMKSKQCEVAVRDQDNQRVVPLDTYSQGGMTRKQ